MNNITIKPHHFIDIIKLYGAGIKNFVPDKEMGHDFYKVANCIINNGSIKLSLTLGADDICKPCKKCEDNLCIDSVNFKGYTSKDIYNKNIDKLLMDIFNLDICKVYSAKDLCKIILQNHEEIFNVWTEEDNAVTTKRHEMFVLGAKEYLHGQYV